RRHLLEELLVGLEEVDPAFRVWLIAKRNTLRDRLLFALESAMTVRPAGSREESRLARALINLDPTHEDACRRLMQGRASAGDMAGALRIYDTLRDLLADEYGIEPSVATKSLLADLKTEAPALNPAPIVVADPQRVSTGTTRLTISLPPVAMHDVNPEKIHLVDGFRQHLIASLIRFREWQVTDTLPGDVALGEAPGGRTRYELQMSVHQNGPVIHLLLILKELEHSQYIWSDRFELKLESWFEAQRHSVQCIALALNVYLSAERLRRISEHPDVSLGIYDRWLRCQTLIRTFNLEHWEHASRQFLQIIEGAPNFVPAYCGLADMNNTEHIVYPGRPRTRERERQAIHLARQAVEL
ncbi:MAG: bacterial transcriptional activator domain-containing protein, partial [Gammaproteobacteria bacterium]|nr:bacterial transcriptional activator domain-containing protein [Gammaproteobacteria bacterium]